MSRSVDDIRRDISATEALRSEAAEQMDAARDGLFAERLGSLHAELEELERSVASVVADTGSVHY